MPSKTEQARRKQLSEAVAQAQWQADVQAMPLAPTLLHELFDDLDQRLHEQGCHHDLRLTEGFLQGRLTDWPAVRAWLGEWGGFCDCEVLANVGDHWPREEFPELYFKPRVRLFPELQDVFADVQPWFEAVFFPLLSVDLDSVGTGPGVVHFVSVHGSGDPELALRDDWFAFDRIRFDWDGQRYRFGGDMGMLPGFDQLPRWLAEARQLYAAYLVGAASLPPANPPDAPQDLMERLMWAAANHERVAHQRYLSTTINYWITRDKYHETGRFVQGSAYAEGASDDERPPFERLIQWHGPGLQRRKIGTVIGYNYKQGAEDRIHLFIEPGRQQVVQRFGWT